MTTSSRGAATVPGLLHELLARDGARPLVTHLGPGGDRTELSVRTYENNVAKAANLLRDDADLQPGGVVALGLPLHWQTSVWLGACALLGATAWIGGDPAAPEVEVAVVGPDALAGARAPMTLATALHPLGMPFTSALPADVLDVAVEVRSHGDRFTPSRQVVPSDAWLRTHRATRSQEETLEAALSLGRALGIAPGSRVLCARPADDDVAALALLAVPLALDVAVVLLTDPDADPEAVALREGCLTVLA